MSASEYYRAANQTVILGISALFGWPAFFCVFALLCAFNIIRGKK